MAYNKSKAKGSAFELKIAKLLTEEFKLEFKRVPLSGALEYWKGDVFPPMSLHLWPWTIECKHYKQLNLNSLLTAKSNDLHTFWQQAVDEAKVMDKKPLVIFRWDRSKDFIMWQDEPIVEDHILFNGFNHTYKIAELTKWIPAARKFINL